MTGTEGRGESTTTASTALEHFVVGRVLEAEQHPDADRLQVCTVDLGDGDAAQIVCGAPNVAAGPDRRGRAARRGDARRHQARQGQAARRRVRRDDPGRGRARASAPTTPGSWCSTTSSTPGTPLADVLPIATDVLELEITPNRPDCLGSTASRARSTPPPARRSRPPPWADDPGIGRRRSTGVEVDVEAPTCARASPRACSRT